MRELHEGGSQRRNRCRAREGVSRMVAGVDIEGYLDSAGRSGCLFRVTV
jgi:hypothetical protein